MSSQTLSRLAWAVAVALALHAPAAPLQAAASSRFATAVEAAPLEESPAGRYLVDFDDVPMVWYRGDVPGFAATAAAPSTAGRFDADSDAAHAYSGYLRVRREARLAEIARALGRSPQLLNVYTVARHGVSLALSLEEARQVARLAGVKSVLPVRVHPVSTFRGPQFIGAGAIWDGSEVPAWVTGSRGEGMTIGVIDTGINADHPSFADDAGCGFDAGHPKLVAKDCSASAAQACTGSDPEDHSVGHGPHTAGTAAGNTIPAPGKGLPDGATMSGVAPCSAVITYKACTEAGCYDDWLAAAVQAVIVDQVDVVNFSIGRSCGYDSPWQSGLDFLAAHQTGIFVAAAAGNTANACTDPVGRVTNLAPWVTTVAASSKDRVVGPALSLTGPGAPDASLRNILLAPGSTTLAPGLTADMSGVPLRIDADNPIGCTETGGFPPGHFNGAIAVIRRGTCNFGEKISNAAAAGAAMVVVTNNQAAAFGMDTEGAPATIAAFSISDLSLGDALIQFIGDHMEPVMPGDALFASGFDPSMQAVGDYARSGLANTQGDVLGSFSLRGPVPAPLRNLPKPDLSAPGVDIFAAIHAAGGGYGIMSGTSMATPHVAGAAALLRSVYPDWAVDEIKSALVTTAASGYREDGITPWTPDDAGSGRVNLVQAVRAGLTMVESEQNYLAANPADGTLKIEELNLPSMRNVRCGDRCSWTRSFRNRLPKTGTWTLDVEHPQGYRLSVVPEVFTLDAGETQDVTVTATIEDKTVPSALSFGSVTLREASGTAADQSLPVGVAGDEVSVSCSGGVCTLKTDNLTSGYAAVGCEPDCRFLWANRYSVPAHAFPLTLTSITFLTGSASYTSAGDVYDFYVYQDDDSDPTNGAQLAGSHKGHVIASAGARLRTVELAVPIVVNGPGDVVIALANRSGSGPKPAAGEISEFRGRSYAGSYVDEDPDLGSATVGLALNPDAIGSEVNWVIRAVATTASGAVLELGGVRE